ncbi:MAG: hypothetical protein QMD09_10660 [Desulfatibacillaceae bacterium]|nr:hypothetical protein [Desulfatibacillaceae bacterium]
MIEDKDKKQVLDEVGDRLDDFFSDDDWGEGEISSAAAKPAPAKPAKPAPAAAAAKEDLSEKLGLKDLKVLVLSLEWEITDSVVDGLVKEVVKLKPRGDKDPVIKTYLSLMELLGKYIRVKKGGAHPESFTLMGSVYQSMESVLANPGMPENQRKRSVLEQVQKFNRIKKSISTPKVPEPDDDAPVVEAQPIEPVAARPKVAEAAPVVVAATPVPAAPAAEVGEIMARMDALKKFVQNEIRAIKEQISEVNDNLSQALTDIAMAVASVRQAVSAISGNAASPAPAAQAQPESYEKTGAAPDDGLVDFSDDLGLGPDEAPAAAKDDGLEDLGGLEPDAATPLPGREELALEDDLAGELGMSLDEEGASDLEIDLPDLDADSKKD